MSNQNFTSPPPLGPDSRPISLSFPDNCDNGRAAVITINSPETLNALNWEDYGSIRQCLEWIAQQPRIMLTILTGKGRYFSAGANVQDPSRALPKDVQTADPNTAEGKAIISKYYKLRAEDGQGKLADALRSHPKVMIAALNVPPSVSHCYRFALRPHLRLRRLFLLHPFTSLALVAEGLTSVTFVQRMGLGRATEALLEGRKMMAHELKESASSHVSSPNQPNSTRSR